MPKKEDTIILYENLRNIDILDDYWKIAKECRESYYNLLSLENFLNNKTMVLEKQQSSEEQLNKINELNISINKVKEEFIKTDGYIDNNINNTDEISKEVSIDLSVHETDSKKYTKCNEYIQEKAILGLLLDFIKLKENIDRIQLEVLTFLNKNLNDINKVVLNDNKKLENIYVECSNELLVINAFRRSTDEDKIVTYKINCKNKELKEDFKKQRIKLPKVVEVVDYSFNIKTLKRIYYKYSQLNIKLLEFSEKIEKQDKLDKLNKKQYYFNIIVTISTIISTIIAIISLI